MSIRYALDGAQFAVVLLAMAAVQFAPPARGRMLVVPLSGDAAAAVRVARDADALVVGRGPLPRSAIVEGARARLLGATARAGMVLLAAPQGGCAEDVS